MINYLVGLWLTTTVALAQTPQKPTQSPRTAKAASATTTAATSATAQQSAKSIGSTKPAASSAPVATAGPKSGSAAGPPRPLPEHSLKTKLQSNDNVNPNYQKEKDRGRGIKREYTPRRTASGARKDTMSQRKP